MAGNTITAYLKLDKSNFDSGLGNADSKLASFGKNVAKGAAIVGTAATGVFVATKPLVDAASDLNEVTAKTGEIYGNAADPVMEFAKTAARSAGLSERAALDFASQFGQFGKAAGLSGNDLSDFGTDLTGLASDLASFNNLSTDEAAGKLLSGLAGETEPLRELGIFMSAAAVEAKALEMGLTGVNDPLTEQEKVLARTALIWEQTADAQGDFARTSDGFANQQRILAAEFENLQAELGQKLLPMFIAVTQWILDDFIPAMRELADWLQENVPAAIEETRRYWEPMLAIIESTVEVIMGVVDVIRGVFTGDWTLAWEGVKAIFEGVWTAIVAALELAWEAMKLVMSNVLTWLAGLGESIASAIGDLFSLLWQKGWDLIQGLWNGIKENWYLLALFIAAIPFAIPALIVGAAVALLYIGRDFIQGLWDGILEVWEQVKGWFGGLPAMILGAVPFLGSLLIEAGKQVVAGFVSGINSMAGAVAAAYNNTIGLIPGVPNIGGGNTWNVGGGGGFVDNIARPSGNTGSLSGSGPQTILLELDGRQLATWSADAVVAESEARGGLPLSLRAGPQ